MSRSETAEGGSSVSYRPAVSETGRLAQSRRSVSLPSRPAMSRSEKSRVAAPAHAERSRSADLAFSSTRPVGWSCRCRTPAEVPRKVLFSSCSANPYSFLPAAWAARKVSPSAAAKSRITPISVRPGAESHRGSSSSFWPNDPACVGPASSSVSSAGACSASRTTPSIWSGRTPARDTTPAEAPWPARRSMAMTVSWRERDTPLVVSVLPAQRRAAVGRPDPLPRRGALARAPVDGDDGELAGARHAVGGERVARPAQVRGRGLLRDHDAWVTAGGVQGPLDGVLGRVPGAHDEAPSSAVLSIRTPRSRAAGQPWLTGAIWPGWPLPQLNAPASR